LSLVLDWVDCTLGSPVDISILDSLVDVRDGISVVDSDKTGVLGGELFFGEVRELVEASLVGEGGIGVDRVDVSQVLVEVELAE